MSKRRWNKWHSVKETDSRYINAALDLRDSCYREKITQPTRLAERDILKDMFFPASLAATGFLILILFFYMKTPVYKEFYEQEKGLSYMGILMTGRKTIKASERLETRIV